MIEEETVNFYSDNFLLQGVLSYNEDEGLTENAEPTSNIKSKAALLCSPHPNLGGDMDNNIILEVAETLNKNGFVTLRFNYRGVGESESRFADIAQKYEYWEETMGSENYHDFVADAQAAMKFLKDATSKTFATDTNQEYFVIGYSFGSIQAMRLAHMDNLIKKTVCISLPFGKYDLQFAETSDKPKYFICFDNDFAASSEEAQNGYKRFSEPKSMEMVNNCDHFCRGMEDVIAKKVFKYLKS